MAKIGKAAVKELFKDLAYSFEIPFEEKCFEILSYQFHTIEKVPPRGELDSTGIDLFWWNPNKELIEKYFQCKGFQVKEFQESQFKQCCKSITSFLLSDKKVSEYYLIINRTVLKEYREKLEQELNKIIESKKAEKVFLLDIYKFLDFIWNKETEIIIKDIKRTFRFYYSEYTSAMNQRFYYDDVPFLLENKSNHNLTKNLKNPLKHIICKSITGESNLSSYNVKGKYFLL